MKIDSVDVIEGAAWVGFEPFEVVVHNSRENLVEEVGTLAHTKVEKVQHNDELFADGLNEELVEGPEHLLKDVLHLFGLGDVAHEGVLVDFAEDVESFFNVKFGGWNFAGEGSPVT